MDPYWAQYSTEFTIAGFSQSELSQMSVEQKRAAIKIILESTGAPFRDVTSQPDDDVQILTSPTRSVREPSTSPVHARPNLDVSILQVGKFRRLASLSEAAAAERVADPSALQAHWRQLVADLAIYSASERIRYSQQIQAAARDIGSEADHGIGIAVILPGGMRITRVFAPDVAGSALYLWCAADERMIKEMVKPGAFVIVFASGRAVRPSVPLGEQIGEQRVLLNVRLI